MLRHVVSRAWLMVGMFLTSLALVVFCPSGGAALPFLPELTSGSFHLERGMLGGVTGGVSLSTPNGDAFSLGFLASAGFGAGVTGTGAFVHDGQFLSPAPASLTIGGPDAGRAASIRRQSNRHRAGQLLSRRQREYSLPPTRPAGAVPAGPWRRLRRVRASFDDIHTVRRL